MSRPRKYNADYFSHDNDMRNHRKVKAIRNKFGLEGYAIFNMLLETFAESNNFILKIETDIEWELLSADYELETDKLKEIIEYLIKIDLITKKNDTYSSPNLIERLSPLLEKREYLRDKYTKTPVSTAETKVSTAEMPQSKVKESKGNNIYIAKPSLAIDKSVLVNKFSIKGVKKTKIELWQDEASNAIKALSCPDNKISSVFKCFKDNEPKAKIALSDCKELSKLNVLYFFKVFNELTK